MMSKSKGPLCPLLRKPCVEGECAWWVHITGVHPQSGAQMDLWDCSIKWTPVMMLDASKNMKNVQAAVESMRNDVVDRQDNLNNALVMGAKLMQASKAVPTLPADVIDPNNLLEG